MVKIEGVSLFSQQHKPSEIKSLKKSLIMDLILRFSLFLLRLQRLVRLGHGDKMAEGSPTFEEL